MRYFALADFQQLVLALAFGALGLVFAAAAWVGYPRRRGPAPGAPAAPVPGVQDHPVPLLLRLVYAAVAASSLGYALVAGVLGGPVGY